MVTSPFFLIILFLSGLDLVANVFSVSIPVVGGVLETASELVLEILTILAVGYYQSKYGK